MTTEERRPRKADRRGRRGRRPGPIELLIVDEHPVLRAGVRTLLEHDEGVAVVGEADSVAAEIGRAHV